MHILITKRTPEAPWRCRNACVVHAGLISLDGAPGERAMQLRWLTFDRKWRFWWLRLRANPNPKTTQMRHGQLSGRHDPHERRVGLKIKIKADSNWSRVGVNYSGRSQRGVRTFRLESGLSGRRKRGVSAFPPERATPLGVSVGFAPPSRSEPERSYAGRSSPLRLASARSGSLRLAPPRSASLRLAPARSAVERAESRWSEVWDFGFDCFRLMELAEIGRCRASVSPPTRAQITLSVVFRLT